MLSYQHIYHAGNLADVHKHALLATALDYMTRKDKPLSYLETHAGRGAYDLSAAPSVKTGEAAQGIVKLAEAFPADHPYARVRARIARVYSDTTYPGSPLIASQLLRDTDTLHLAELHPQEFAALEDLNLPENAKLHHGDGLAMALARTPPTPRRGLMLIDPSYEVKDDYAALPRQIAQIHRKWNVGALMLWYPILTDARHKPMLRALRDAIPAITTHEVSFKPARPGHGMIGSGMVMVNPPFGMDAECKRLNRLFAPL
jgi:23S rRNA (adenine2030-N6)-methyltransferase